MRKKWLVEQLAALKQKRQTENARLTALAADGQPVPPADVTACLALDTEIDAHQGELDGIERLEQDAVRRAAAAGGGRTTVHNLAEDRPFESLGEFLQAVTRAAVPGSTLDPRLQALASGGSEGSPSDGGFLVQPQFAELLYNQAFDDSNLASRCDRIPIGPNANRLRVPIVNESSRATGSRWGGVRVYRADEATTVTNTKPQFDFFELALEKLMGLAYATDELLADSSALEAIYTRAFSAEMAYTIDDEIIAGNGAGRMLGILNSNALVVVNKESGQANGTVVYENIPKMWTRMPIRNRRRAVWLINQDVEAQLYTMSQTIGTSGVPVYLPPGGASDEPYSRLFGRPVIPVEQCKSVGQVGDIILVDLTQYAIIEKGGLKADRSMHVRFIYGEETFRWTMRNNGQPKWKSPIAPANGSNSVSPFVALQAR